MQLFENKQLGSFWQRLPGDWKVAIFAVLGLVLYFVLTDLPDLDGPGDRYITSYAAEPPPEILFPEPPSGDELLAWKDGDFGNRLFFNQLREIDIPANTVQQIIDTLSPVYDFRKSHPKHHWKVGFDQGEPTRFVLEVSPVEIYDIYDLHDEPVLAAREVEVYTRVNVIKGQIEDSLFGALTKVPRSAQLVALMEDVFAWDIDFHTDLRKGDKFDILVEESYIINDGEATFNGYGHILAARYFAQDRVSDAFRYEHGEEVGYYNSEGQSLIRDFMRSPLKLQPVVTSSFKPNRFHPVLKKVRPHNGVDYRARRGTPVMAVADGRVLKAGRFGGAGIMVELQHRNDTITHYMHFSKLANGIKVGMRVRQGQVVGYVGKTGLATSEHLHFGMKVNGKFVDPQKMRYRPGKPIGVDDLPQFLEERQNLLAHLEPVSETPMVRKEN